MKKELIAKRSAAFTKMKEISAKAKTETRELSAEEIEEYNAADKEFEDVSEELRALDKRDEEIRMRIEVLEKREKELGATPGPVTGRQGADIGMEKKEVRKYSLLKAIRAAAKNDWSDAGLEREVSEAMAKKSGNDPQGFYVPHDVLSEQRDMNVTTDSAGGYLVADELQTGSFIDLLKNKMVVRELGATILDGLTGNIDIPKKTAGATAYWLAESGEPTESQPTLGQVPLTPKTVGAYTDLTRKFLKQSSLSAENFVRMDLASSLALGIDLAAIAGSGSGNQPTGILNISGIGAVAIGDNGGPITWAKIVDLETEVATDNADIGKLAYLTNTKVRGACKKIEKAANTARFLWEDGKLNDYNAFASNQVTSALTKGSSSGVCSAMIFGNWADLLIGTWGGLDILVDPYSNSTSGGLRITAFQDVDIQVRHAESFAACKDITTA